MRMRNGARLAAILVPLGAVVAFLALFRIAIVNYLGSAIAWYVLFAVVVALLAVQVGLLALQGLMERSPALQNLVRRLRTITGMGTITIERGRGQDEREEQERV